MVWVELAVSLGFGWVGWLRLFGFVCLVSFDWFLLFGLVSFVWFGFVGLGWFRSFGFVRLVSLVWLRER
jgi:hypothetical protein